MPAAVAGLGRRRAGAAGAVSTADGQRDGDVAAGRGARRRAVSLDAGETGPHREPRDRLAPPSRTLPWPVDVAYATAPTGQVVGISPDGKAWMSASHRHAAVAPQGASLRRTCDAGGVLHVLTRQRGRIALFAPGRGATRDLAGRRRPPMTPDRLTSAAALLS